MLLKTIEPIHKKNMMQCRVDVNGKSEKLVVRFSSKSKLTAEQLFEKSMKLLLKAKIIKKSVKVVCEKKKDKVVKETTNKSTKSNKTNTTKKVKTNKEVEPKKLESKRVVKTKIKTTSKNKTDKKSISAKPVTITVYGNKKTFKNKKEAIKYFEECMEYCDPQSSEYARYSNIVTELLG